MNRQERRRLVMSAVLDGDIDALKLARDAPAEDTPGACRCCGKQDATVRLQVDPFACEVDDDCGPCWICDACVEQRRDDI